MCGRPEASSARELAPSVSTSKSAVSTVQNGNDLLAKLRLERPKPRSLRKLMKGRPFASSTNVGGARELAPLATCCRVQAQAASVRVHEPAVNFRLALLV